MRFFGKTVLAAAALAGAIFGASGARAGTLVIDVTGALSYTMYGYGDNTKRDFFIGAGAHITRFAFEDVTITAFDPSYLSEAGFVMGNQPGTDGEGVSAFAGAGETRSGTGTFTRSINIEFLGLDFYLGSGGMLYTEFFDSLNDAEVSPDARWESGRIVVTYDLPEVAAVPEPATWVLMVLGFGAVGGTLRRRPAAMVRYAG